MNYIDKVKNLLSNKINEKVKQLEEENNAYKILLKDKLCKGE